MHQLRLIVVAAYCALFVAAIAAAGPGGAEGGDGWGSPEFKRGPPKFLPSYALRQLKCIALLRAYVWLSFR